MHYMFSVKIVVKCLEQRKFHFLCRNSVRGKHRNATIVYWVFTIWLPLHVNKTRQSENCFWQNWF